MSAIIETVRWNISYNEHIITFFGKESYSGSVYTFPLDRVSIRLPDRCVSISCYSAETHQSTSDILREVKDVGFTIPSGTELSWPILYPYKITWHKG